MRLLISLNAILLSALCLGCGFQQAMQRAERAEAEKDWAAAATAYEAALRHDPDDQAAASGLAAVRRRWHTQSLNRFEKALGAGDLDGAQAALRQAEAAQPSAEANRIAARRLLTAGQARQADGLRIEAQAHRARQDLLGALDRYTRAQALHPTPAGKTALDAVRAALETQAHAAREAGRWRDADRLWAGIAKIDPQARGQHEILRAEWITTWRDEAQAFERQKKPAFAFVRWVQVSRLSGAPADIARRNALRAILAVPARMQPSIELRGAPHRVHRIIDHLSLPSSVDPKSPRLTITGDLQPIECTQSELVEVRSERYQSGTRRARNPRWDKAQRQVRRRRADRDAAESRWQSADQAVWRAEQGLADARRANAEEARRERQRVRRTLKRARDEEARCQDAVRTAGPNQVSSARARLQSAQRDVDRAWQALEAISEDVPDRAMYALKRAREDADRARRSRQSAQEELADAERRLDGLAPTVEEPVHATHRFPVSKWTRRCAARATLSVQLNAEAAEALTVGASDRTVDRSHAAQVVLGLNADPLRFPKDDATLSRGVDGELAKKIRAAIARQRSRWRRQLVTRMQAAPTRDARIEAAVRAVLADARTDPVADVLRDAFGVENLAVFAF